MTLPDHVSAKSSHYNKEADHYDLLNEENSAEINRVIEKLLKKYRVKTVLDLTCGTGSQLLWLSKKGFQVTGSDISSKMLKIARAHVKKEKLSAKLLKGDMRTLKAGKFDAAITIFNAVGHLTKLDFEKAMQNIHDNLNKDGLYLFDINNLRYLLKDNQICKLTIDWQKFEGDTKVREIQYSTISSEGILASYTTNYRQKGIQLPKIIRSKQTLQVYDAKELRLMLQRNGFKVIAQCGTDGSRFIESKTDRLLTIAKRVD